MPAPTVDQQLADARRLIELADHMTSDDYRLIGCLIVALSNLADCVEQLNKRLAAVEEKPQ